MKKEGRLSMSGGDGSGPSDQEDYINPPRSARRDPDEYKSAKKNLRKAMLEHYRYGLSSSIRLNISQRISYLQWSRTAE